MEHETLKRKHIAQRKYRDNQQTKGLVRYEFQVNAKSKELFEAMVDSTAAEFDLPWDKRQRKAKARALLFDKITQGVLHDFVALHNEIVSLKQEVKNLSPSYFKAKVDNNAPLPQAVRALPDDPKQLKQILAKTLKEAQKAQSGLNEYKRKADQYEKLYETTSQYNDELKNKLEKHSLLQK